MMVKINLTKDNQKAQLQMKKILFCLTLIIAAVSIKLKLTLGYEQQRCFYQVLTSDQKYAVEVQPLNNSTYILDIRHQENNQWRHSVTRRITEPFQNVTLNKLASKEALYSFCLINTARQNFTARISLRWGMELLDLIVLAQQSDQEMLQREAKWIDKQADKIVQIINSSKNQLGSKEQLRNMMSSKFICFAILGVLTIIAINVYFYFSARKTFRERKMI